MRKQGLSGCLVFGLLFIIGCVTIVVPDAFAEEKEDALGYYVLGNENVSFHRVRVAEDSRSGKDKMAGVSKEWEERTDPSGKTVHIFRESAIGAADIESVRVSENPHKSGTYALTLYFKREAWDRVHDWTGKHVGQRVGLVVGDRVLWSGLIRDRIVYSLRLLPIAWAELQELLGNFDRHEGKADEGWKKEYVQWVYERALKSTDDEEKVNAAHVLMGHEASKEVVSLLEPVVEKTDAETYMIAGMLLGQAYAKSGRVGQAIAVYSRVVNEVPSAWYLRKELAVFHETQGQYQLAYEEVKQILRRYEIGLTNCALERQLEQVKQSAIPTVSKNKLISDLERQLEENNKYLHGN